MDEVNKWLKKIEDVRNGNVDLSRDEDLSIALMNLISLEEHFYFTAMKTGNNKYLEMLDSVRLIRTDLLKKIVVNPAGEEWCISKHLLAASMRLIEVGTKELRKKNLEADNYFKLGFQLYSLFFAINLKMIGTSEIKETDSFKETKSKMEKFTSVIKKIVDCCKEW